MKSWKTTVGGLLAGIGAAVAALPDMPSWLHVAALVAMASGPVVLGFAARDNKVSTEEARAK